jgi:anti-sigma factor RsiW
MSSQHLSDEAIAAFADGVLAGHARERASRHAAACPECAYAVAVQREAVWALRAAPAPALPTGLLDRLRSVPADTPIEAIPTAIGPDGSAMFAAFGTMTAAAIVPPQRSESRGRRVRPMMMTAAAVAVAGVVVAGSAAQATGGQGSPVRHTPVLPAGFTQNDGSAPAVDLIDLRELRAR